MRKVVAIGLLTAASTPAFARTGNNSGAVVFIGIVALILVYIAISGYANKEAQRKIDAKTAELKQEFETERQKERAILEQANRLLDQKKQSIVEMEQSFAKSYIAGRKWLAQYIAEAFRAPDEAVARALEYKKNPAIKAADQVRQVSAEKKELRTNLKYLEYVLKTYHEYYPALEEYSDDILNEMATLELEDNDAPDSDRVTRYISQEEYARLSVRERNQLALDKWKARKKSNVEIGRIYERYLGHLYEKDGWQVVFIGAMEGLEDMGRDLLCVREDKVHVVQAKYWSQHRTVHEKHIFQLYGTCVLIPHTYPDLAGKSITPVFATTTKLSETAQWAAKELRVTVKSTPMDQDYPVIKCNVNGSSKIYHLPFDQQYDRVRIIPSKGEFYALTVAEAEKAGFRRAKKHYST